MWGSQPIVKERPTKSISRRKWLKTLKMPAKYLNYHYRVELGFRSEHSACSTCLYRRGVLVYAADLFLLKYTFVHA